MRRLALARLLALLLGGWLLFDGCHAWITGSFVTASAGPYAGQLGPWAMLPAALGIPPLSPAIRLLHIALGAGWLLAAVRTPRRRPLTGLALASLWYLPFGTAIGLGVIGLLLRNKHVS